MRIKIFDTVLGSTILEGEPEMSIESASEEEKEGEALSEESEE